MNNEVTFKVQEHVATLSASPSGWYKELNVISWNGAMPKYDIREWAPDHEKMGKGITLTDDEAVVLVTVLKARI